MRRTRDVARPASAVPPRHDTPAQTGRVSWPVLAGVVLGLLVVVVVLRTSDDAGAVAPPVVGPGAERPPFPVALPEGIDPSEVEVLDLPPPPDRDDELAGASDDEPEDAGPVGAGSTGSVGAPEVETTGGASSQATDAKPRDEGGRIRVSVTPLGGGDLDHVLVWITDTDGHWAGDVTETDGAWLSEELRPGDFDVLVSAPEAVDELRTVSVRSGETAPVSVTLEAGNRHFVDVYGLESSAAVSRVEPGPLGVRRLLAEVEDSLGHVMWRWREPIERDGAVRRPVRLLLRLRPGTYRVRLSADGTVVAEGEATVVAEDGHSVTRLQALR